MRQQPVVAEVDTKAAEYIKAENRQHDPGPAEQPGQQCQQGE